MSFTTSPSLRKYTLFVQFTKHLRETISWSQAPSAEGPPLFLPNKVGAFLSSALGTDCNDVQECWDANRDAIWSECEQDFPDSLTQRTTLQEGAHLLPSFLQHGTAAEIGFFDLYPPTRVCLEARCSTYKHNSNAEPRELLRLEQYPVTVFTRDYGSIPGWSYSAKCPHCKARYYHNYIVQEDLPIPLRTFYPGVPSAVQVSMHYYVEDRLVEHFTNSMVCAWVSATNIARIYNLDFRENLDREELRTWPYSTILTTEIVWDSFFLYALLLDCSEQNRILELPHHAQSHDERIATALKARNEAMAGPGQEQWNHACDLCCEVRNQGDKNEALRAVVTDGITIGCPCCGEHDCKEPLPTQRSRFCRTHSHLERVCSVVGCSAASQIGHKTCETPSHRACERNGDEQHTALFQLRKRLERLKVSQTEDSTPGAASARTPAADELREVDEDGPCESKSSEGNTKPRARFGIRRTHNEQLCVACCGVILGRATMFGSEGPHGVLKFLEVLFPTQYSTPGVIFYDNNCQLKKVINNSKTTHFDNCILPVDVFHMKTKHKESDDFCTRHCNPAKFPDLISNGKWRFNSSAAEMTNVWFGGYQAQVRDMRIDRYTFFLDEMVKRRNRIIIADLLSRGAAPYLIPKADLLATSDVYTI